MEGLWGWELLGGLKGCTDNVIYWWKMCLRCLGPPGPLGNELPVGGPGMASPATCWPPAVLWPRPSAPTLNLEKML